MDVQLNIHANIKDAWKYVGIDGHIVETDVFFFVHKGSMNDALCYSVFKQFFKLSMFLSILSILTVCMYV